MVDLIKTWNWAEVVDAIDCIPGWTRAGKTEDGMADTTNLGLDKVRLKKNELIATLEKNLGRHRTEYEVAHRGWKSKVVSVLRDNLLLAEKNLEFKLAVEEAEPVSHVQDYERVIALLKASMDDVIILTRAEFHCYCLDEWVWKKDHTYSVLNYSGSHPVK